MPGPPLTPLQRAIYETDLLGLTLRDSSKLVTARMGFFVGQHRYLEERAKIAALVAQYGPPEMVRADDDGSALPPRAATHQIGTP